MEQKIESLVTLLSAAQGAAAKSESQGALEPPQDRPHVNLLRDFPWENDANAQDGSSQKSGPSASNTSRASINCTLRDTGMHSSMYSLDLHFLKANVSKS